MSLPAAISTNQTVHQLSVQATTYGEYESLRTPEGQDLDLILLHRFIPSNQSDPEAST